MSTAIQIAAIAVLPIVDRCAQNHAFTLPATTSSAGRTKLTTAHARMIPPAMLHTSIPAEQEDDGRDGEHDGKRDHFGFSMPEEDSFDEIDPGINGPYGVEPGDDTDDDFGICSFESDDYPLGWTEEDAGDDEDEEE